MASNVQLVSDAEPIVEPPIRKLETLNELQHIVYQNLAQHTQPDTVSCWQAMVGISDRTPCIMSLIERALIAIDAGDPVKITEWSSNFELETFHKSVSKGVYDREMDQKIQEFFNQRKGNEPTIELLRERYGLSLLSVLPRPKVPGDVKELLARRKPV